MLAPFVLAALAAATPAATVEVLPDLVVRLRAARYFPSDDELKWEGWVGAGAGLVRVRGLTAYVTADIETIIGSQRRTFDANQVNYHLEAGARGRLAGGDAALYFNHVSRHYSDREKEQAVDWNELGVRYGRLLSGGPRPVAVTASIGHTTLASLVGYEWIATAELDAVPLRLGAAGVFLRAGARAVKIDPDPALPRGSFVDAYAEAGPRWTRDGRVLDLFAAVERRNDVFLEVPGVRERMLIGFRINYLQ